jgi:hypothetical protein
MLKIFGLVGFMGGLAALAAYGHFGPVPETIEGWIALRATMRSIFFPCVFAGLIVVVIAGVALWLQMPRTFLRMRWFRVKAVLLAVFIPLCHFWARGQVMTLYAGIDAGDLNGLAEQWRGIARAYLATLIIMMGIAVIGRVKPRFGQTHVPPIRTHDSSSG